MPDIDGTCPECGSAQYYDGHCIACAMFRVHEQQRQMHERSGPRYELTVSRARAGIAAWRAAGSPRKVTPVYAGSRDADGNYHAKLHWYLAAPYRRGEHIEATPEQVAAWQAWCASRTGPG